MKLHSNRTSPSRLNLKLRKTPRSSLECHSNCPNLLTCSELEKRICELSKINGRLTKMNEFLLSSTKRKDHLYSDLYKKYNNTFFSSAPDRRPAGSQTARKTAETVKKISEPKISFSDSRKLIHKRTFSGVPADQYYNKIKEVSERKNIKKNRGSVKGSFLALKDDLFKNIINDSHINDLQKMTLDDNKFLSFIKQSSENQLLSLSDTIGNLISDFHNSVFLIKKIKQFLHLSNTVTNSQGIEEAIAVMINLCCQIMNCERASIFTYDQFSNSLVIHSGKGTSKNQIKVPSDKGVVGYCFTKKERVKIDDAYEDDRFDKSFDLLSNYRTKSILCVPMKDVSGQTFGVIQSLNKLSGFFTNDDEEIMDVFSQQAASILQSSISFNEHMIFGSRMKILVKFNIKLRKVQTKEELVEVSEFCLRELFGLNKAALFLTEEDEMYSFEEKQKMYVQKGLGILNYVKTRKEMIGFNNINDSQFYNSLVDLETGLPLLTLPVMNYETYKVLAVLQFEFLNKFEKVTNQPKEPDLTVVNMLALSIGEWLLQHK